MSVEEARRAPVQRLSDRLSFGAVGDMGSDVDDTMMDILANRPTGPQFDENDDTFDMRMDEYGPFSANSPLCRQLIFCGAYSQLKNSSLLMGLELISGMTLWT
jgi:hypothetical protein